MKQPACLRKQYAIAFTTFVSIVALLILLGWKFNIEIFKRPISGLVGMNPVMALSFMFSGISIRCLLEKEKNKIPAYVIKAIAFVIVIIGALKLAALIFNYSIAVDTWLFTKKLITDSAAGNTLDSITRGVAVNMVLLGLAIYLSAHKNKLARKFANYQAMIILLVGLFAIIGYIFRVKEYHVLLDFFHMPIHTTVCFMLIALSILFLNDTIGFMQTYTSTSSGGTMARLFIPSLVLIPIILGYIRLLFFWKQTFGVELSMALLITCIIIVSYLIVWRFATALNKTDDARRQAEEALRELNKELEQKVAERTRNVMVAEYKFQSIIENSFDIVTLIREDFTCLYRSPSAERITGWPLEELEKVGMLNIIHPEDMAMASDTIEKIMANPRKPFDITVRMQHRAGHYMWVHGIVSNYLDDPDIKALVTNFRDITARKLAEEKLEKSELRLKEAQAIACIGNWEIDVETGNTVWSDELYSIYGVQPGEIEPSKELFLSLTHPDDLKFVSQTINENFPAQEDSSFNFRFIRKDGACRYGHSEWKYGFNKEGRVIRIYGIIQDITERKIAEEERSKIINDLLQRNKDHEQFAYIVSHNLRAPVANIIGFSSALQRSDLDNETTARFKEGLYASSKKLDTVIKDLSHILQVRREISEMKQPVCLSSLVDDVQLSISNMIEKENVTIRCEFTINEMITIKTYLHSIFYNLISNSIKYRQPSVAPVIEIRSRIADDKIQLFFKDNGTGIDLSSKEDQLFGLYKRFHPQIEGKGIGLFMTKTQVETMGGRITVSSEVNKGTEFKMEFPL